MVSSLVSSFLAVSKLFHSIFRSVKWKTTFFHKDEILRRLCFLIILLSLGLESSIASAVNCRRCYQYSEKIEEQKTEIARLRRLDRKNRAYLERVKRQSKKMSVKLKLTSNILITGIKIETALNQAKVLRKRMAKKGCDQCPRRRDRRVAGEKER